MSGTYTSYSPFNPAAYIPGLESLSIKTPEPDNSKVLKTPPYVLISKPTFTANTEISTIKYQELLVSNENIKTINGESILGSGDLEINNVGGGGLIGLNMNIFGGGNASTTEWGLISINCGGA